jgi:DNA-binding transcriptional regulator YdaS (Cro superfamily)
MTKEEAIYYFGSQNKLAKFLGVYQSNVSGWKKIPIHHQLKIDEHTEGELEADDHDKMLRYQVTIEKKYLDIMKECAEKQSSSVVQVLRNALDTYYKVLTQKS